MTYVTEHSGSISNPGKLKKIFFFFNLIKNLFWPHTQYGILVPRPGNPSLLNGKHGVLTTGPPGKSPYPGRLLDLPVRHCSHL